MLCLWVVGEGCTTCKAWRWNRNISAQADPGILLLNYLGAAGQRPGNPDPRCSLLTTLSSALVTTGKWDVSLNNRRLNNKPPACLSPDTGYGEASPAVPVAALNKMGPNANIRARTGW